MVLILAEHEDSAEGNLTWLGDTWMLINAALTTSAIVILVWHSLVYVCVGKFVWLMVPLCVLISCLRNNKPYREVDKAWNGRHTDTNKHTSLQENLKALQEKMSEQSSHMLTHAYSLIPSPVYTLPYSSVWRPQGIFHNQFLHCDGNAESLMSCGCGRIGWLHPGLCWLKDSGQ